MIGRGGSAIRALFEDVGARGWLHAVRLDLNAGAEVAVKDADNAEVAVHADESVPMASVYKLPLLAAFCELVDAGELDPRQQLTLQPEGRTPGPTGLSIFADPVTLSLRDLAVSMMSVSDNAAADALLDVVGLDRLAEFLHRNGLAHTVVRRGSAGSLRELLRRTKTDDPDAALAVLADNDQTDPAGVYEAANASASTTRDMTKLLGLLWSGAVLSPEQTGFVQRAMGLQVFGHRLAAGFPHDAVKVAGKTGTFGALRHEVGVVELPDGSAYAIAIFTRAARGDRRLPRVDAAIGQAARLAVDHLRQQP